MSLFHNHRITDYSDLEGTQEDPCNSRSGEAEWIYLQIYTNLLDTILETHTSVAEGHTLL